MKNTRLVWFVLIVAFAVLARTTDFGQEGPRWPLPENTSPSKPKVKPFGDRRYDTSPVSQWLLNGSDNREPATGTAFAVADGIWLTARHVVRDCDSVWIVHQGKQTEPDQQVHRITLHPRADIALLHNAIPAPHPLVLTDSSRPNRGAPGFHFGYPGGEPGDVHSRFLGESSLKINGRGGSTFPIQVWAATEIPARLTSLGGLSGGPVFDGKGRIHGVTIAESPRRGRVASTTPLLSAEMIELAGDREKFASDRPAAKPVEPLNHETYNERGDDLRDANTVVQIYCHVRIPGQTSWYDEF